MHRGIEGRLEDIEYILDIPTNDRLTSKRLNEIETRLYLLEKRIKAQEQKGIRGGPDSIIDSICPHH